MRLYNTMSNKLEEFEPIEEGKVKMYVCGPTVYNYIHLGNARPIVVFDILARYFKYRGYDVTYVQNFTDVDDKIIKRANEEKVSPEKITEKYIQSFFEDTEPLNVLKDIKRPRVTENINEIIEITEKLIENGYAYEIDGNVFFDVKKYNDYGKLSNQKISELEIGARVDIMEIKNNPLDFALWKKKKDGEPYWDSPWGEGRPGWHIECSAMSRKYLGDTFDIHGGGQDLIFPHHENEIAQSKCAYHGHFAKYWLHNGFVQIDGDKMSKSMGNFFLLREILGKFSGNVVRLFILSTHYRKPINFSFEDMENTRKTLKNMISSLKRFEAVLKNLQSLINHNNLKKIERTDELYKFIEEFKEKSDDFNNKFIRAMDEDLNTPQALSTIFDQIREMNKFSDIIEKISDKEKSEKSELLSEVLNLSYKSLKIKIEDVLGVLMINEEKASNSELSEKLMKLLLKIRSDARKNKNFELSDEIRDGLRKIGVEIKDNKDGTTDYTLV
ncbi:cysteine--tRNA ligase [Leptotrichia sp. OH3620_COT-345]|uniref:cysteine--tRNA ligase n=1 Tax=Leptotrichia sp. OH3620_COT-345 TaxID=2491048 RepID=UPI000F6549F8|nr:cysteine--tRNA ligase [Leptotrichia sp. OH3620_COT-345]RRD40268.1 cysteine--tRNA ligase [Leptotrichia sp. OH3620_COT-345]